MADVLDFVVAPKFLGEKVSEEDAIATGKTEFAARLKSKVKTADGVDLRGFREILELFKREAKARKRKHKSKLAIAAGKGGAAAGATGATGKKGAKVITVRVSSYFRSTYIFNVSI